MPGCSRIFLPDLMYQMAARMFAYQMKAHRATVALAPATVRIDRMPVPEFTMTCSMIFLLKMLIGLMRFLVR